MIEERNWSEMVSSLVAEGSLEVKWVILCGWNEEIECWNPPNFC